MLFKKFQVFSICQFRILENMYSVDAIASVTDSIQLFLVINIVPAGRFLD